MDMETHRETHAAAQCLRCERAKEPRDGENGGKMNDGKRYLANDTTKYKLYVFIVCLLGRGSAFCYFVHYHREPIWVIRSVSSWLRFRQCAVRSPLLVRRSHI